MLAGYGKKNKNTRIRLFFSTQTKMGMVKGKCSVDDIIMAWLTDGN